VGLSPVEWLGLGLGACAAFAYAAWAYLAREERRPHAWALALLRGSALAGALFLWLDPSLPAPGAREETGPALLVDGSWSMEVPAGDATLWREARARVLRHDGPLWLFGGEAPRPVSRDSLPETPPFPASRLAPALRAAVAAGHRAVRVVTDGQIEDGPDAAALVRRYGLAVEWVRLEGPYPRVGIAEVRAPVWAEVGDTAEVRAYVAARADSGAAVRLRVLDARGRARAEAEVEVPAAGRLREARLRFRVPEPAGLQRFEVVLADDLGDPERREDRRAFYLDVSGPPASPVLLALAPSWEATFLLPNLSRAGVAPAVGFVRVRGDRWVRMGGGYEPVTPPEIRRRGAATPLLVVLGYGDDAPSWVRDWVRAAPAVWVFPAAAGAELPGWGVRVGGRHDGEWYPDGRVPPSPLAGVLAGIDVSLFPPLAGLHEVEGPGAWAPLEVRLARRGGAQPALVAGTSGGRRWAVGAGVAYWRWGIRPGAPGDLYRGLMTGIAGWLLAERGGRGEVAPAARVVDRGAPFRFLVPRADSVRVEVRDTAGALVWSARRAPAPDTLVTDPLPPGRYAFEASAWQGARAEVTGAGPLEVEPAHPELLPGPLLEPGDWAAADVAAAPGGTGREAATAAAAKARRPLRRAGWPFLAVLGLVCAEWVLRRRWALP
jgi:hypothetical protein